MENTIDIRIKRFVIQIPYLFDEINIIKCLNLFNTLHFKL